MIMEIILKVIGKMIKKMEKAFFLKIVIKQNILEYGKIIEEEKNPSSRFWELHDKINLDKKKTGVQLVLNKKDVEYHLLMLLKEKAITINDLDVFSNEWKEYIISCYRIWIDSISISLSGSK